MKRLKHIVGALSLIFALVALVPMDAHAELTETRSGTCGDDLTWTLTTDGTLTISGTGEMDNYGYENAPWYEYRNSIQALVIENGVTSIGNSAFQSCGNITSAVIPDGLTEIPYCAFSYCLALTSLELPDTITKIGMYAFQRCSSLTEITIPDGVTIIEHSAFNMCKSLVRVTIPDSVTIIEDFAFQDCESLAEVIVPGSIEEIDRYVFAGCTNLTDVTLCKGVVVIGESAFNGCTALENVTLPEGVTTIGWSSFSDCESLRQIELPASVTKISSYAFNRCLSLQGIDIPDGVTLIPGLTFQNCTSLAWVGIPVSVTNINNYAFDGCTALEKVIYTGTKEQWESINFTIGNDALLTAELKCVLAAPTPTASVNAVTGKPTLTWEAIPGADKYEIFRCDTANGTYIRMTTITGTTYTNGTAIPGQTYYYKVRAVSGTEYSVCSAVFKVKCILPEPAATAGVNTATGKPTLTWEAIPGAEKYEIFRCDTPNGTYIRMTIITGTVYTNGTAVAGKTYYYKVRAVVGNVTSTCANIYTVTCAAPATLAAPVVTASVNVDTGKPMLTWNAVSGAEKYEIFRCDTQNGTYIRMTTVTGTTYTNGTAVAGKTYYYKVRAVKGTTTGVCCAPIAVTCAAPAALTAPVVTASVNAVTGKPTLTWRAVPGAEKYEIFRCDTANGTYIRMYTTTATSYSNGSAVPGQTYYYKVRAVKGTTNGSCCAAIKLTCAPAAPVVTASVNAQTGKPMLTWTAVSGAEAYEVFRCDTANGTYIRMTTITGTVYTNGTAEAGKTYYYKVRAKVGTVTGACCAVQKVACVAPATAVSAE